jgi:NAD-dependent protein deacetylase/lipoamidase
MPSRSQRIVVLTGAGISRESGLDTFRDAGGIWATVKLEDVATPGGFERDPALVHAFYNARRRGLLDPSVKPNAAHDALALLEENWPGQLLVVTQNIDNLHERAGTRQLVHMHGELLKARCLGCDKVMDWPDDLHLESICPGCWQAGGLRPHVVWFGEMPFDILRVHEAVEACDVFVSIGTSGIVYPAAGFVEEARRAGAHTVELNLEPSEGESRFAERVYGPATEVVPAFVEALLRQSRRRPARA